MSGDLVSIIIVNYNTAREINKCLQSVYSLRTTANIEVIIVDNASTDGSVEMINDQWLMINKNKKEKSSIINHQSLTIRLIVNQRNLGFAVANNIGAKAAKGDFFFFLNPDTEVKKDTISKLLEFAKKKPNLVIGPKILNPDGSIQGSCYNLPKIFGAIKEYWLNQRGAFEKFAPKGEKVVKVQAVVGAAMFMSKKIFENVVGFDERYFLYYEDLDFCRKAAKLKIPVYYFPQAIVFHSLGKAGGQAEHLKKSAKIYHGILKYFLITLIIKISQWLKL